MGHFNSDNNMKIKCPIRKSEMEFFAQSVFSSKTPVKVSSFAHMSMNLRPDLRG